MRLGDLIPGDVFYLVDNLSLGPLIHKDATPHLGNTDFIRAEPLIMRHYHVRFMYRGLRVIKVGRIEGDNHGNG